MLLHLRTSNICNPLGLGVLLVTFYKLILYVLASPLLLISSTVLLMCLFAACNQVPEWCSYSYIEPNPFEYSFPFCSTGIGLIVILLHLEYFHKSDINYIMICLCSTRKQFYLSNQKEVAYTQHYLDNFILFLLFFSVLLFSCYWPEVYLTYKMTMAGWHASFCPKHEF